MTQRGKAAANSGRDAFHRVPDKARDSPRPSRVARVRGLRLRIRVGVSREPRPRNMIQADV